MDNNNTTNNNGSNNINQPQNNDFTSEQVNQQGPIDPLGPQATINQQQAPLSATTQPQNVPVNPIESQPILNQPAQPPVDQPIITQTTATPPVSNDEQPISSESQLASDFSNEAPINQPYAEPVIESTSLNVSENSSTEPLAASQNEVGQAQHIAPAKKPLSLVSYYCGMMGLVPFIGFPFALGAVITGIFALKKEQANLTPDYNKHAIIGVALGSIASFCMIVFIIWFIVSN